MKRDNSVSYMKNKGIWSKCTWDKIHVRTMVIYLVRTMGNSYSFLGAKL